MRRQKRHASLFFLGFFLVMLSLLQGCSKEEKEEHAGKTIVVILPDMAERYLSSVMFENVPTGIIQDPLGS